MPVLTVALLQMVASGTDQDANLRKGDAFCRRARAMGADIALFPEMWNIGYTPYPGCAANYHQVGAETPEQARARAAWQEQAIGPDDAFVVHFRKLARELDMAIALTYLERWPGAPRNTVSLIDRHGEIVLTYAKVHTCDFGLEAALTPGDDFPVCTLDTAAGPVRVGAMICFDREFPESARLLMLNGAEIILTPNACPLEPNRIGQFRSRAFENMVGVAMANYAAPQQNGHSVAFDPIAFDEEERSRDTLIVEAGEAEGIYLAPFDLDRLRAWRRHEVWGNAFRRPHRYGPLVAPEIQNPFVRRNAHGAPYDPTAR
ncbi:carbon-nitrogen hydrolase family protein [Sphaerobacter sp.]|uniref:carbon-nitrogen hydrolase family protein n=1 Tax=Sphaerobacter sp. TaxID=2099654 RepID=UPI001D631EA7|nr:carbon-nitrogen hydrolase family protein [Sphaerobacter sp.]MBX5446534.1 carbon-nitrogen hydrolase family protein [Sphaerobacter sp.]